MGSVGHFVPTVDQWNAISIYVALSKCVIVCTVGLLNVSDHITAIYLYAIYKT